MAILTTSIKRLLVGRALRSDKLGDTLLPKRVALPIFASSNLSSNAYATQEILLVLAIGGIALLNATIWIALLVVAIMGVVIISYRQNVRAYSSGGGDYEVASKNLGKKTGLVVASSLMIDYVMTVAVSVSAAKDNLISVFPWFVEHSIALAIGLIIAITTINLRGIKESGFLFSIPAYTFIFSIFFVTAWALVKTFQGEVLKAESADWEVVSQSSFAGIALIFLFARAFSSGCSALTGVEAISNGVPAFKKPKSKNAATTLLMLGLISASLFMAITFLAIKTGVQVTESNQNLIGIPEGQTQKTVIVQIAEATFTSFTAGTFFLAFATVLILIAAANTAFNGFPVLTSILSQDRFLPRQLHNRGDRLAFSNGILFLGVAAAFSVFIFDASVTRLIQIYILAVFTSVSLGQLGMVFHWTRLIRSKTQDDSRSKMIRSRIINFVGFIFTFSVLLIVLITKFLHGAWIVVVVVPILITLMGFIYKHYKKVNEELTLTSSDNLSLPSRIHGIILVSKLHKPTLRAIYYARATRSSTLEAVTVNVEQEETNQLLEKWLQLEIPVPLKVLDSPFREVTRPILDYVKGIKRESPRDVIAVFVPQYVVGHWWEQLLHNQSALRLKTRLLFTPGVMVVSVPWQLVSTENMKEKKSRPVTQNLRRP